MQRRLIHLLLFLLAMSPGLWMANYVVKSAVDVGCWDVWENGPLIKKWHEGTLTWHDLYAPQIQHRIVVPRLLITGLTYLGGGDFRWEQWATFSLSMVSALLLWMLLSRSLGQSHWRYGILFAANLLIFSPMLYQSFFWGSSLWMAIPLPCLLGALVILGNRWPQWLKYLLAVLLAEIATHSFSHGLVMWPVVLGYLLLQPECGSLRRRLVFAGIWIAIAAATIGYYFHDFINAAHHAYNLRPGDHALKGGVKLFVGADAESLSITAANLARIGRFFSGMFGALFARSPFTGHFVDDAQTLGVLVISPLLVVVALVLFSKSGRSLWRALLPFLAIAAYVVGVAMVISIGRAHLGEHRCALPRYFNITGFMPIATMVLWFLWSRKVVPGICDPAASRVCDPGGGQHGSSPDPSAPIDKTPSAPPGSQSRATASQKRAATCTEFAKRLGVALLAVFAALQLPLWRHGLHLCRIWNDARWQARALVMFINHEQLKPWSINVLDMDLSHWGYPQTREQLNYLKSLDLLNIPLLETPELRWFHQDSKELSADKAAIESVKASGNQVIVVGNARFGSGRPADLLLITAAGSNQILALGVPTPRAMLRLYPLDYEFTNNHEVPVGEPYRWEARIRTSALPAGIGLLDVWALDGREMRIARLSQKIQPPVVSPPP